MRFVDIPKLSEDEAWVNARATLVRHPQLQRIFEDKALAKLIRRRQSERNHLLFWLVLPADDERSLRFWSPIVADLLTLEHLGSFDLFRDRMRHEEKERLTSWRTELWFAAWLVRNGIGITLEPAVGNKHPEFVTETVPQTWWEVKTPLDILLVRDEDAMLRDVKRRLREIPEPFVLHLVRARLSLAEVPSAVKGIKAQIRAFAQDNGELPARFKSGGLIVEAGARTKHRATGFLGTTFVEHVFENEQAMQIADKIDSAVSQLPSDGAGIVVIDRTLSNWTEENDAINACFGQDKPAFLGDEELTVREQGFFRQETGTRISAVVSYSGHPMHWENCYEMLFIHNPFAKVPLPEDLFRFPGIRHMRRVEVSKGRFRLDIVGDEI